MFYRCTGRGKYSNISIFSRIVEVGVTKTDGESSRPRNTNQPEAVTRRGDNAYVVKVARQTRATVATNKRTKTGTQIDSEIPHLRATAQVVARGNRTNASKERPKRAKANVVGTWSNRPENAHPVRTWVLCERGLEKNNIYGRAKSCNYELFRHPINGWTIRLPPCNSILLKSDLVWKLVN